MLAHPSDPGTYWGIAGCREVAVLSILLFLIIVWIVLGIIGAVVHGLIWLLIIAAVLFLATLVFGGSRIGRKRTVR